MNVPPIYQALHQGAAAALHETLANLPTAYLSLASMFREVCADPDAHWPHPLFLLNTNDLQTDGALSEVQLVGWQFLAKADGERAYAIEIHGDLNGNHCQMARLAHGPFVDSLWQALNNPDLLELLNASGKYLALLIVSELDTQFAWIRALNPTQEFLFALPLVSDFPTLYQVKQFEEAMRKELLPAG